MVCQAMMRPVPLGYCSLRLLGEDLAAAGYPTLRFDYPATGNALDADLEQSGAYWAAWQDSIVTAIDWLRETSGAKRIVLCGVRSGGALAVLAASRRADVAGLLLFEPSIVGSHHVRQFVREATLRRGRPTPPEQGLEISGMRFNAASVAEIAATDLRQIRLLPGQRAAIFHRPEFRTMTECAAAWAKRGNRVANHGFDGLLPLVSEPPAGDSPLADFTRPIAWLRQAMPQSAPSSVPITLGVAMQEPPGCIEMPIRFGPDNRLFGMLCRPDRGSTDDMVLIPNSDRDPSFGAGRQHVALARRLAQAGIASFRFDFSGLGDSQGPTGRERLFPDAFTDRTGDMRAAVDAMATLGFFRFTLCGRSVGAWHALRGALADDRLSAIVLSDLPHVAAPDTSPSVLRSLRRMLERLGLPKAPGFARRAIATLSRRGVRTLYLLSRRPQDIVTFAAEFGTDGAGLRRYRGAEMRTASGADRASEIAAFVTAGR